MAYLRNVPAAAALIRETIRFRAEDKLDSGAAPKLSLDSTFICPARQGVENARQLRVAARRQNVPPLQFSFAARVQNSGGFLHAEPIHLAHAPAKHAPVARDCNCLPRVGDGDAGCNRNHTRTMKGLDPLQHHLIGNIAVPELPMKSSSAAVTAQLFLPLAAREQFCGPLKVSMSGARACQIVPMALHEVRVQCPIGRWRCLPHEKTLASLASAKE